MKHYKTYHIGKRSDGSQDIKFEPQERFQLNLYGMVMMGISAYAQSKMQKLADMIKGSATEAGRERYILKRNYYSQRCKQWVPRMEASVKAFERGVIAILRSAAEDKGADTNESIRVVANLIDWNEEYLRDDMMAIRSALRKEMKAATNNELEDLTMFGHLFEAVAATYLCNVLYVMMCDRQPLFYQITEYHVFGCLTFRNVLSALCSSIDLRMKDGSNVKLSEDVFLSNRIKELMTGMLDKLTSVQYASRVNKVTCEADDSLYQEFVDFFPTDSILGPMPKVTLSETDSGLVYSRLEL